MTLNLAERLCWLSHCRNWSVCVGFLYTVMDRPSSTSGLTIVSKKGMDPSSLLSSTVNLIAGSTLLMSCRKSCLLTSLWMTKVSSPYLYQNLGSEEQYLKLFVLSTPYKGWLQWGLLGNPWPHPQPVQRNGLGMRSKVILRQNSNKRIMSLMPITVLSLRVWSFSSRSLMIFSKGSTGTDVKRADTS